MSEVLDKEPPLRWLAILAGTLLALPLLLILALTNGYSHDEHQHIAAGVLLARDGLLPYRDFAYFHTPYLVYLYGLLFKLSSHYLLVARLFAALCAGLTGGVIFAMAWRLFSDRPRWQRGLIGASAIALLLTAPVVYETAGHAWNQEPSLLLALAAFLVQYLAQKRPASRWLPFVGGFLLSLAIGFRITFAPLGAPFIIMLCLGSAPLRQKLYRVAFFFAGMAVALLPLVMVAAQSPAGFIFGNVEFPKLNITYRMATGVPRTMTWPTKLRFVFKEVMRPNWLLFFGFIIIWVAAWLPPRVAVRKHARFFRSLLWTLPFVFLGSLAPSPLYDQYFFPLAPFLLIGGLTLLSGVPVEWRRLRWIWIVGGVALVATFPLAARKYEDPRDLFRASEWITTEVHADAVKLRQLVPQGRVITLAPLLPLEAGLAIDPRLASGPFGWRVAPYVSATHRAEVRILAPDDLTAALEAEPPVALLLGFDDRWEAPLLEYARGHSYRRTPFPKPGQLWLAP